MVSAQESAAASSMISLKLDTELGQKHQLLASLGDMLTPVSATCEDHKPFTPSVAWSFASQTPAQPFRMSNFASLSSLEPLLSPPHHGPTTASGFAVSDAPFEYNPATVDYCEPKREYVSEKSTVQKSPELFTNAIELSEREWPYIRQHSSSSLHSQHIPGADTIIPACGDFSSAIGTGLARSTTGLHDLHPRLEIPRTWDNADYGSSDVEHHSCFVPSNSAVPSNWITSYIWPLPVPSVLPSSLEPSPSSISSPSDMMPLIFDNRCNLNELDSHPSQTGLPSPCSDSEYLERGKQFIKTETRNLETAERSCEQKLQHDHGRLAFISHTARTSNTKMAKRTAICLSPFQKHDAASKRRRRDVKLNTYNKTLNGASVNVILEEPVNCKTLSHVCREQCAKGDQCGKAFARVEHLRRHEKTHTGEKNISCPLGEEFRCLKCLDRRDNWRDHLKTHLKISATSRNERVSAEQMFAKLREKEDPAEAEKTIEMLKKWMDQGKHLSINTAQSRQQH